MGIERAAQNIENEAITNPQEAAASMKLIGEANQIKLLNQMQEDADRQNASLTIERDKSGQVSAIHFEPLFHSSNTLGFVHKPTERK